MYDYSVNFLTDAGYDPFPISKEDQKAFEKEYPDPYRWRIPEPIKKLFTKRKKQ